MDKQRIIGSTELGTFGDSLYHSHNVGINNADLLKPGFEEYLEASNDLTAGYLKYGGLRFLDSMYNNTGGFERFSASENVRPKWNECMHIKNAYVHYPFSVWSPSRYKPLVASMWKPFYRYIDDPYGCTPWDGTHSHLGDWESASRRAWWSMQPRFEGKISTLNYLFELKDFRDIAKSLYKIGSPSKLSIYMRKHKAKMRRISKKLVWKERSLASYGKNVVKQGMTTAKILAQLRLLNEFAIKPLISDTATLIAQAGHCVQEAQAKFQERGQGLQTSHYSENAITDSANDFRYIDFYLATGTFIKHTFTASLEYSYNYKHRNASEAFLKYWGLRTTPEVIWNAIPFSFLADYFAKIGDAIHFMSTDPNVKLLQYQYCESILTRYSSGIMATGDPDTNLLINGKYSNDRGNLIKGYTGTFYQRKLKSPNKGAATPRFTLPSGGQGANMAALAMCFIK